MTRKWFLALVDSLSSDVITMKILIGSNLKTHFIFCDDVLVTKINNRSGDTWTAKVNVKVSGLLGSEVQVGNTSGFRVSSLLKDPKIILDGIVWNEMFGKSSDESFKGFDEVQ